ncbi:hypothetical protein F5J12DRAFT_894281 [Pisolithus orientalis]|uniref:uncharacterized protein n=1 Tax=Pisolithus orientalis TaxID=936130 RepID=UPI0022244085|nr:uncharacterized protein F5J12DRAFT_894281 [Pisolithus orientalis]KAI6002207.1 hypothetical protein F5J12DRAFT_894281 [Pisolithus orientalis]
MRLHWPLFIFLTLVQATGWFGSDDPVDCSSITSAPSAAYSHASREVRAATHTVSDTAAQATRELGRAFDETKDYVFSTWDDSRLRKWLEDHDVVEARKANTRQELLDLANLLLPRGHEWLVAHNLLPPHESPRRETLLDYMKHYYYSTTDKIWHTWSESELKAWLVNHGILKSDAQKQRDELIKLMEEHYLSASDSIWGAWRDSDIRKWLTTHGYIDERTASRKTRDDLVDLINSKYADASVKSASYLVWPDARLRAYLRERGVSEDALPTSRPGLLQETRIRWVQASTRAENIFAKLRDTVNSGVIAIEDALSWICDSLADRVHQARQKAEEAKDFAWEKGYQQPFGSAGEGTKRGSEGMRQAGERIKSEGDEL